MTAAVIVQLAQEGKLKFSDPVSDYVPDVPNGANITVAELLKMRSGLYNYTNAPEFSAALDAELRVAAERLRGEARFDTVEALVGPGEPDR